MFRIDSPTNTNVLPTPLTAGNPGYFQEGNPATSTPYTVLTTDWANQVQEELMAPILSVGETPSKTVYTQLLQAIQVIGQRSYYSIAPGAGSFTVPPWVFSIYVELWGGGGGGGAFTGASGAGGGLCCARINVTPGQVIPYFIGLGGHGDGNFNFATAGGNSTFLSLTAVGGSAGGGGPGPGGIGIGGDVNMQGGPGDDLDGTSQHCAGGSAPRGGLGGCINMAGAGISPVAPGGGGAASAAAGNVGFQDGAQGGIWIHY